MLIWVVLGLLGVYVARALTTVARTHILGWLGQHIVYDLQIELFKHLQLLSLNFYNTLSTGRIMTRVTSDTERMRARIGPAHSLSPPCSAHATDPCSRA